MILTPHLFIFLSSDFLVEISPFHTEKKCWCNMKCAVFRNISYIADKAMLILENALEYLPWSIDCHLFWCKTCIWSQYTKQHLFSSQCVKQQILEVYLKLWLCRIHYLPVELGNLGKKLGILWGSPILSHEQISCLAIH